jgi:enterochelin esterase family protein
MTVETYRALGLDKQPMLEMNGRGSADFQLSLNHPGDNCYHPCPEASPAADVPVGEVAVHRGWAGGRLYEGTRRDVFVYTPAGFDRGNPASLIVFNDGFGYLSRRGAVRATRVLDTLHARGEIAPTVGVFVNPGNRRGDEPDWAQRRREYDPLTET